MMFIIFKNHFVNLTLDLNASFIVDVGYICLFIVLYYFAFRMYYISSENVRFG